MVDHLTGAAGYLFDRRNEKFLHGWSYSQIISEIVRAYAAGTLSIIYDEAGKCCGVTTARKLLLEGINILYITIIHTSTKDGFKRFLKIYRSSFPNHILAGERKEKIKIINPKLIERI